MKQEVKDEWLAALRSGEYAQANGRLHVDDGYCCLGVLCEVAVKAGVIEPAEMKSTLKEEAVGAYGKDGGTMVPPLEVIEWAELDSENPNTDVRTNDDDFSRPFTVAELNDEQGYSFAQIADVIERCL